MVIRYSILITSKFVCDIPSYPTMQRVNNRSRVSYLHQGAFWFKKLLDCISVYNLGIVKHFTLHTVTRKRKSDLLHIKAIYIWHSYLFKKTQYKQYHMICIRLLISFIWIYVKTHFTHILTNIVLNVLLKV